MVISWFGLSCFKVSSGELTMVTDPFAKETGLTPPRIQTDIVIISNNENPAYNNRETVARENTFVIDGPGEFDVKGLFVRGIFVKNATIYAIRMEDIRLGFLGAIKEKQLSDEQLESLGEVDILFVPVGGKTVCDAEEAVTIINQVEPHLIIPMHYQQKGLKLNLEKLDIFLKEFGTHVGAQDKLTLRKSEIQDQESKLVVLNPVR